MTQPDEFITAMESTRDQLAVAVGGTIASLRAPREVNLSWRAAANTLAVVLVVAMVAPFVVHAVPALIGAEHSYVVTSGSMEPAIGVGSVVMVDDVDPERIERGDVITFTRGGAAQPTTHRVVEVIEDEDGVAFRTKGDANEDPDQGLVTPEQVEGRVMSVGGHLLVVPYIGYVIAFANTQTGYAAMVVVPIVLLVVNELYNLLFASDASSADRAPTDMRAPERATASDTGEWYGDPSAPVRAGAAIADAPTDTAVGPEDDVGSEDDAAFTLRPIELRLGMVVLAAFAAYSIWVAYDQTEVWSTGIAAAVSVAFLLAVGLYLSGGSDSPDEVDGPTVAGDSGVAAAGVTPSAAPGVPGRAADGAAQSEPAAERSGGAVDGAHAAATQDVLIRQKRPAEAVVGMPHQPVGSFATLVNMAASAGQPIYQDPDWETHYLVGREILYVHRVYPDDDARALSSAEDSRDPGSPAEENADEAQGEPDHGSDSVPDDPVGDEATTVGNTTQDGRTSNGTNPGEGSDD